MKTFNEIVLWVEKNVPKKNMGGHHSASEAAKWFVAYTEASIMSESNNTKDWAHMLVAGIKPLDPEATVKWWAENSEDRQAVEVVTEKELKLFFGL